MLRYSPHNMNGPALAFDRVSKRYGRGALILDAVSFEVRPGEFFGLAGVNGAGKTSLIKSLSLARANRQSRHFIAGNASSDRKLSFNRWLRCNHVSGRTDDVLHRILLGRVATCSVLYA